MTALVVAAAASGELGRAGEWQRRAHVFREFEGLG
jgi:hypothetical protein